MGGAQFFVESLELFGVLLKGFAVNLLLLVIEHAAASLARERIAFGGLDVGERQVPRKSRFDQAEIDRDGEFEAGLARPADLAAAWNRGLEHRGIVERFPDALARRRKPIVSTEIQGLDPSARPLLLRLFRTIRAK